MPHGRKLQSCLSQVLIGPGVTLVCEHMFVPRYTRPDTIPYVTFRTAVEAGDLQRVQHLAKSVRGVKLDDALRICRLTATASRTSMSALAVRCRRALEARGVPRYPTTCRKLAEAPRRRGSRGAMETSSRAWRGGSDGEGTF